MNKLTLITGATSGIGQACAEKFAANKHDLIITGRRESRLKELAEKLKKNYGIQVSQCRTCSRFKSNSGRIS